MTKLTKRAMLIIAASITLSLGGCYDAGYGPAFDYGPYDGPDAGLYDGSGYLGGDPCWNCGIGSGGHWHHAGMPPGPFHDHGRGFGGHGLGGGGRFGSGFGGGGHFGGGGGGGHGGR
jgi:hypothetical protein